MNLPGMKGESVQVVTDESIQLWCALSGVTSMKSSNFAKRSKCQNSVRRSSISYCLDMGLSILLIDLDELLTVGSSCKKGKENGLAVLLSPFQ